MSYLLLDTSTNSLIMMLHDTNKCIDLKIREGKSDHQAHVIPMIESMLKENKLTVKDLEGIIVGVGPGSYTGLRVGVMTAKMLSYASGVKLYKISSLIFLTSGYKDKVLAWHDARNNQGFSAVILNGKVIGEEAVLHDEVLTTDLRKIKIILDKDTIKVDGAVIVREKVLVDDIYKLIPNYLRKTEAKKQFD